MEARKYQQYTREFKLKALALLERGEKSDAQASRIWASRAACC